MGLFKDPKKPVIRPSPRAIAEISPLRPKFAVKRPPCNVRCAAGADVRGWVTVIAQAEACGRSPQEAYEEAWRILADAHPFPATLGRICPHPCEQDCHRRGKDGAVAINALERWLGDVALARGFSLPAGPPAERAGRVAVVGSGPAGLSCAYQLARRGHRVEVFEAHELSGGRLRDATRTGRLAAEIVDAEIARVRALGLELHCGFTALHGATDLEADFDAVFLATGRKSIVPPVEGAVTIGDAANVVQVGPHVFAGGDAVRPGMVPTALDAGRRAARAIAAAIDGAGPEPEEEAGLPVLGPERLKVDWYEAAPRGEWSEATCGEAGGETDGDRLMAVEAKRCFSCGLCMDCERCWMYCTNNCFEKLPKGQHYRVAVDLCNGCRKCADECPCGYIDMV